MATTSNITIRMDAELKSQLQDLMNNLGLDITAFFTMAAKQAVRDQALPFHPEIKKTYDIADYMLAMKNTKYNDQGKAVITEDDEWANEPEWDNMFEQMKKERGIE